jgi:hypothetical protein
MTSMKGALSRYLTYVLVVFGFLIGLSLRDLIGQFEKSKIRETTQLVAGRFRNLDYSNSESSEKIQATAFDRSTAANVGLPASSTSQSIEMIRTTVFDKSMAESFGFLKYPASKWELKKKIHAWQSKRQ